MIVDLCDICAKYMGILMQIDIVSRKCRNGEVRYSNVGGYIWREIDEDGNIIENNLLVQDLINDYNIKNPVINGVRHNIKEWCEIYKISTTSVYKRIKKGMSVIEAITTSKKR